MEGKGLCNSEIASICPQGPVFGVDWHKAKGRFEVRFGRKLPGPRDRSMVITSLTRNNCSEKDPLGCGHLYYPLRGRRDDK